METVASVLRCYISHQVLLCFAVFTVYFVAFIYSNQTGNEQREKASLHVASALLLHQMALVSLT